MCGISEKRKDRQRKTERGQRESGIETERGRDRKSKKRGTERGWERQRVREQQRETEKGKYTHREEERGRDR